MFDWSYSSFSTVDKTDCRKVSSSKRVVEEKDLALERKVQRLRVSWIDFSSLVISTWLLVVDYVGDFKLIGLANHLVTSLNLIISPLSTSSITALLFCLLMKFVSSR